MYTAVVLTPESQTKLLTALKQVIPFDWKVICHHMTINMGNAQSGPAKELLGQNVKFRAISTGQNDKAIAVTVDTNIPSTNAIKHITVAVNIKNGGKPVMSNQITDWHPMSPIELDGVVQECN